MTIQKAIGSGRWFRRKGWSQFWKLASRGFLYASGLRELLSKEDILANDWETK